MTDVASSGTTRESRLVRAFVEIADTQTDGSGVAGVLHRLVEHCVQLLDATAAGLLFSDQHGSLQAPASSTEQARLLELFQIRANEGPCLDCYRTGEPILVADLSTATTRWPSFVPEARREGFATVHAMPLRLHRHTIGALNLFRREPGPLYEQDLNLLRALADVATISIVRERAVHNGKVLTDQLQNALSKRVAIEQAKGVLSHAGHLEMDQAFHVLRMYGRRKSTSLSGIAHDLIAGTLDPSVVLASLAQPSRRPTVTARTRNGQGRM